MDHNVFSEITPEIVRLAGMSEQAGIIDTDLLISRTKLVGRER